MELHTRISRLEDTMGTQTGASWLYKLGIRAWLVAITSIVAALIIPTIPVAPAHAQDGPDVEVGDGAVRVGDEVFAGDGCVRTGDVAVGECGKDSGKAKGNDGDKAGGNTKTPEESSDRPQEGGGNTGLTEPDPGEGISGTTGTTGPSEPDGIVGGTTVMESTGPAFAETTRKALTGPESTGSTAAGEPADCPVEPPKDARTATVERAVDGDTVELKEPVDGYDRVRLIGVNTPEMGGDGAPPEAGAEEATAFTAERLEGKEIQLETDEEVEDPYGRLLAYVWIPDSGKADAGAADRAEFFNLMLIEDGYADVMTVEPNDAYAECLSAAETGAQDGVPNTTGTTGGSTQGEDGKGENEGLLGRLRNLISSKDPSEGQTTGTTTEKTANEDQYDLKGTTSGPLPPQTVGEKGFQGDTSEEDPAPDPAVGSTLQERTSGADSLPSSTGDKDDRGENQELGIQKPEEQQPKIQEPEKQDPARSSELGANSDLAPPELADPDPGEFAAPHSPPPAGTDTEIDPGTDPGAVADQAQITTLPETSGVSPARLAALPAGVLLVCSGLFAALVRGPQETKRHSSGG